MKIETNENLNEFFRKQVLKAQNNQNVSLNDFTQMYLISLFEKAMDTKKLFQSVTSEEWDEPLAILFGRALSSENAYERFELLRGIGDRSLYVSGFFSDSLARKLVDVDYYISMGGNAYSHASSLTKEKVFSAVFGEMAEKFRSLVEVVSEVSEALEMTSNENVLRLYERWQKTKSERLKKILAEKGISVCSNNTLSVH